MCQQKKNSTLPVMKVPNGLSLKEVPIFWSQINRGRFFAEDPRFRPTSLLDREEGLECSSTSVIVMDVHHFLVGG